MELAINKTTNRPISAFAVYKDGSYQNLDRGEWIAPQDSISNWEDITEQDRQVHYVGEREYINHKGTKVWCSPHFAVYPNSKAITKPTDPLHKNLQDWLFNRIKVDDLELYYSKGTKPHKYENKIKLSELDINWNDYGIEVVTKSIKKLRADIILPFNKRHCLLGEGIFFEIQLSHQNKDTTYSRSIERTLHGYSTCWLFRDDFIIEEDGIQLKSNLIKLNSFSEEIHYAKKGFVSKLKEVVENQCRFLDNKIAETNNVIQSLDSAKIKIVSQIQDEGERYKQTYNEHFESKINLLTEQIDNKEKGILEAIKKIEENPHAAIIDCYKIELEKAFESNKNSMGAEFDKLIRSLIEQNNILKSNFQYYQKEMTNPAVIGECRVCNVGVMILKNGKYGSFYGCSNYPNCKNIIKSKRRGNGETI